MSTPIGSLLIAIGFVVCWSSGFIGGRLASEAATPVLSLFAWRFVLAALLVGLWWWLKGSRPLARQEMLRELLTGSLTMGGYLLGVILAIEQGVNAGIVALMTALQPILASALAGPWLGERLSGRGWLGMIIASLGMGLCVVGDLATNATSPPLWSYGLPLLSVISVTLGSLLTVRGPSAMSLPATLTIQLTGAALIFTLAAWIGGSLALPQTDTDSLWAIGWLVVLSSLGGYGLFVASLRQLGVTKTSTLVYLTPAVTLVWTAAMFGEYPGLWALVGMAVAGFGVAVAIRSARKSDPTPRAPAAHRAPRTWSTDETWDVARTASFPSSPYYENPAQRP